MIRIIGCFVFIFASVGNKQDDRVRLIFEEEKGMRSSFCLYSDGNFYETRPSGCVGQEFKSGHWENNNDKVLLKYQSGNIFTFDIRESLDSASEYQVVRIMDCYDQPVRFQYACADIVCENLYNPALLKIKKGRSIFYQSPTFEGIASKDASVASSADTITYKWHCNRESIESINGGQLYIDSSETNELVVLKNKRLIRLSQQ